MWKSVGNLADGLCRHPLTCAGIGGGFSQLQLQQQEVLFFVVIRFSKNNLSLVVMMTAVNLWKAQQPAATSGSCDAGALCAGMCVSRKFLDSRAWNARSAIFYPPASTKFPQLIETIFTVCCQAGSTVSLLQQTSSARLVGSVLVSRDSQTRIPHR